MNENISRYNKCVPNLNSALFSRMFSFHYWMVVFMKRMSHISFNKMSLRLTWWQSSGAGSPLGVSEFPHAAEFSPAAACWCTQRSSAVWWLYWPVPADRDSMSVALNNWAHSDVQLRLHFAAVQQPQWLLPLQCCLSAHCTFMLGWELSVATRLCKVSKPSLMLKRRFCSAEMWVILLVSVCCRQQKRHLHVNLNCQVHAWKHRSNISYLICFHLCKSREGCRCGLWGGHLICQVWWWRLAWMSWKTN